MPDKPQPAPPLSFALPDHAVLAITGRDALAFAQAQFMNDVAALADGQWQWNGWLTPKGRVIALFALLRLDAETLWLVLADTDAAALAAQLQRYVFRSKLALQPRDDRYASGCFERPAAASGAAFARDGDAIELDMGGDGGPRTLRLSSAQAAGDADALARWNAADLAHGLPRLPASQAAQWTPQHLSLERLQAFSVKKGCYPGQEIVARTHFLGQVKRGVALFDAAMPPAIGAEVREGERAIGTIASVAGRVALAVLPLEHPADGLSADGVALLARPLLGGLQR
ncbi:folate-binding protein YgfZ [Thermomonas brevis]